MSRTIVIATVIAVATALARQGHAQTPIEPLSGPEASAPPGHGPKAADWQFPSHVFQLAPHEHQRVQLTFTYGLNQPILSHGFNAAIEVRYKRMIATYSHGQGLDYGRFETDRERAAGASVKLPWTTGGGVGVLLIDEMWILADVKVHRFQIDTAFDHDSYTVLTVGAELGWRYFLWKGFNLAFVARYWPNVASTAGNGVTLHKPDGQVYVDPPAEQGYHGLLANILVGWAFDL
jgi:hypothetical protein